MNNISDKYVLLILAITVVFVFILVFSVKSPERMLYDQPLIWKDDLVNGNPVAQDDFSIHTSSNI